MHLTDVLEGCICQYIRLVYCRDVSLNTVNLLFYGIILCVLDLHLCFSVFSTWWENPSVFPHTQEATISTLPKYNLK